MRRRIGLFLAIALAGCGGDGEPTTTPVEGAGVDTGVVVDTDGGTILGGWRVEFASGLTVTTAAMNNGRVRCVRGPS